MNEYFVNLNFKQKKIECFDGLYVSDPNIQIRG